MKLGARFTNSNNYNETLTIPMSKDWGGGVKNLGLKCHLAWLWIGEVNVYYTNDIDTLKWWD
jgi:hypothetical protein